MDTTPDFVCVHDVAEAVYLAWRWLESGSGETTPSLKAAFNISTGVETSVLDLMNTLERALGRRSLFTAFILTTSRGAWLAFPVAGLL